MLYLKMDGPSIACLIEDIHVWFNLTQLDLCLPHLWMCFTIDSLTFKIEFKLKFDLILRDHELCNVMWKRREKRTCWNVENKPEKKVIFSSVTIISVRFTFNCDHVNHLYIQSSLWYSIYSFWLYSSIEFPFHFIAIYFNST